MARIEHIFIAPEKGAQVQVLPAVEAIAERGLKGDRYSNVVRFLVHRGGLNARIVKGGTISVGDFIERKME